MSWPLVKLGEVAPSKALKNPVVVDDDNVWQLNLDMVESGSGRILKKLKAPHSEAGSSTHWFDDRHVLYSKLRPYLNKVVLPDEEGLATTELVPMLPDPKRLDRRYLVHYLRSKQFVSWISDQVAGAKMPRVSMKVFWDHEIPLPPLDEQKRIAVILDKADAIRQKRKQAIDLADEFLRSVFLDMFGDYISSPDNLVSFGDVTTLDAKMVDPTLDEYANLLHIGPDRITKRTGEILPALTAREEGLKSKKFLFSEEYVIYSKIRPYLRKAAIPEFVALCSADMYPIKPIELKVTREFIWALLLSDFFDNYVCTLPDRASIPKLNKKELAAFQFSLPPYEEIQKFSDIVKETLKNKNTQQEHQLNSKNLFSTLSQKIFSGEL